MYVTPKIISVNMCTKILGSGEQLSSDKRQRALVKSNKILKYHCGNIALIKHQVLKELQQTENILYTGVDDSGLILHHHKNNS